MFSQKIKKILFINSDSNTCTKRTDIKNEAMLFSHLKCYNLNNVLTDIFGKNGIVILSGISSGKTFDQIIESLSPNIRKKCSRKGNSGQRNISKCFNEASDMPKSHKAS